jgi:arylsulfatase A-like enzyme
VSDRPSFLLFCADQIQTACIAANGANPDVRTPNLDALARSGTTFTRTYCPNPICMPSRASIITGLTPRGHGVVTNGQSLPENIPTVTGALAAAGYRTHAAGKLHLQPFMMGGGERGPDPPITSWEDRQTWDSGRLDALPSPFYGFQTADYVGGHIDYAFGEYRQWLDAEHPGAWDMLGPDHAKQVYSRNPPAWTMSIPTELHYNTWIADRSISFLESLDAESFLLWSSFPDPHFPYAAASEYRDRYDADALTLSPTWNDRSDAVPFLAEQRRTWETLPDFDESTLRECMAQTYAMIEHVDDSIGRVMKRLEELGRAENTVVVFMADHGEYLGTHHLVYKGAWPYEQLYRVPFIWRAPDGAEVGQSNAVTSLLDVAPTLLEYAGLDPDASRDLDGTWNGNPPPLAGTSLKPMLETGVNEASDRAVTVEMDLGWAGSPTQIRTVVTDRWKLSLYAGTGQGVLFDLHNDPNECQNLWDDPASADVRSQMLQRLAEEFAITDRADVPRTGGA